MSEIPVENLQSCPDSHKYYGRNIQQPYHSEHRRSRREQKDKVRCNQHTKTAWIDESNCPSHQSQTQRDRIKRVYRGPRSDCQPNEEGDAY